MAPVWAFRTVDGRSHPASSTNQEAHMPRYLVQRTFPDGLNLPIDDTGRKAVDGIVACNLEGDVTWVHSYVSEDDKTTWCIYDAPSPEAIRTAASRNSLPVDQISQITVLDPYFYRAAS